MTTAAWGRLGRVVTAAVLEICPGCTKSELQPGPATRPVDLPHVEITGGPR